MNLSRSDFISRDTLLARLAGLELHDNTGGPVDEGYTACLADVRAVIGHLATPPDTQKPERHRDAQDVRAGSSRSSHETLMREVIESAIPFAEIVQADRKHRRLGSAGPRAEKWIRTARYLLRESSR